MTPLHSRVYSLNVSRHEESKLMPTHTGGCHCGAVTFQFEAPASVSMTKCNCSICSLSAYQHVFIFESDFTLLSGAEDLMEYNFGTGTARHLFCRHCGVKAFYRPRSHPDRYSVNYRAVTPGTLSISEVIPFDGQDWEGNIKTLKDRTS